MINTKRPRGYKAKPPVDLVRRTPKPGRRVPFLDPEDVTFARLAGAHAYRDLVVKAHQEIIDIGNEIDKLCDYAIPGIDVHDLSTKDCDKSPVGLCVYISNTSNPWSRCVYCDKTLTEE